MTLNVGEHGPPLLVAADRECATAARRHPYACGLMLSGNNTIALGADPNSTGNLARVAGTQHAHTSKTTHKIGEKENGYGVSSVPRRPQAFPPVLAHCPLSSRHPPFRLARELVTSLGIVLALRSMVGEEMYACGDGVSEDFVIRRKTRRRAGTSTCSVLNPAANQTFVITLFDGLLLHQAG